MITDEERALIRQKIMAMLDVIGDVSKRDKAVILALMEAQYEAVRMVLRATGQE